MVAQYWHISGKCLNPVSIKRTEARLPFTAPPENPEVIGRGEGWQLYLLLFYLSYSGNPWSPDVIDLCVSNI